MSGVHEEHGIKVLEDVNKAYFVTFLSVEIYILIALAGMKDEMLVLNNLISLPFLNIQIPTTGWFGFSIIAPLLILFLHAYLLAQLSLLSLGSTLQSVENQTLYHSLFDIMLWISLVIFPLFLLLLIQGRYLPYHSLETTIFHLIIIIFDIISLFLLWPRIISGSRWSRWSRWEAVLFGTIILSSAIVSICLIGVLIKPDSEQKNDWQFLKFVHLDLQEAIIVSEKLEAEVINNLRDDNSEKRKTAIKKVSPLTFLQGRDMHHANLENAILPKLDLRAVVVDGCKPNQSQKPCAVARKENVCKRPTQLQYANLAWAQMQEIKLGDANLEGAGLQSAWLQNASLQDVDFKNADLSEAKLQEADFFRACLENASLKEAKLQGANLSGAQLQGANLSGAQLQGASLRGVNLQYARLKDANLQGADLSKAQIEYADFSVDKSDNSKDKDKLKGAILNEASFICNAQFRGVDLSLTEMVSLRKSKEFLLEEGKIEGLNTLPKEISKRRDAACPSNTSIQEHSEEPPSRCTDKNLSEQLFEERCSSPKINNYLVELACSDIEIHHIASGLIRQVMDKDSARLNKKNLAKALFDQATSLAPCSGLNNLSVEEIATLSKFLASESDF